MRVPVAEYAPDRGDLDSSVYTVCTNAIPAADCYLPAKSLRALTSTNALPSTPLGFVQVQRSDGAFYMFAGALDGSDYKLYYYDDPDWVDCSQAGFYAAFDTESGARFAQYGDFVYAATGANNDIQKIDLNDLATGFFDVVGTGGTDPPRARFIGVINEFLVLSGLASYPTSVHWSEIGDADGWRIGTNGSDRQEFPDGGLVKGMTLSEYGLLFQEYTIRRFAFNPGSPYVFEFARIADNSGTSALNSITETNGITFWLAEDGFWMERGGQITPIGQERVDRTFLADLPYANIPYVLGYAEPTEKRVYWAYSTGANTSVRTKLIVYHYGLDRWSVLEQSLTWLGPVTQGAVSIDDISGSIDAVSGSLDDSSYRGHNHLMGGFTTGFKVGTFTGDNLEATLETGWYQYAAPGRAMVQRVSPLVDTASAYVRLSTKENMYATATTRDEQQVGGTGHTHWTASGRYLKGRARMTGNSWNKFQGFEIAVRPLGLY
jgi:hypothetical protein